MDAMAQTATFTGQRDALAQGMADRMTSRMDNLSPQQMNKEKIRQTAEDFESMFLSQMLQHMFENVESPEGFDGGHAEEMYKSLLTDEYADMLSRRGGIGIADHIEREMLKLQETQS